MVNPHRKPKGQSVTYTAKAVHFDGATFLTCASLVANSSDTVLSVVYWGKVAITDPPGTIYELDPANVTSDSQLAAYGSGIPQLSVDVEAGDVSGTNYLAFVNSDIVSTDVWNCYIGSINTSSGAGKLYINDIDLTSPSTNNTPFNMVWNGKELLVGSGKPYYPIFSGDLCDLRIMPGISLLDSSGDIPMATRRLFIDASGKPVDPAIATAALGTPAVLMSGDHTTFGTNQGSGGSFVLSGTLTDATSHP